MLSKKLKDLYDGYYDSGIQQKRVLSAKDSIRELSKITKNINIEKLLDVGSGDGTVLQELENSGIAKELYAVEISDSSIEVINKRNLKSLHNVKKFDGYKIPFEDKSFDISISTYVLEHVEHERLFLKEMGRVSNYVLVSVPLEHTGNISKAIKAADAIGHINFYTIETFNNILRTSGLEIIDSYAYTTSKEYENYCDPKFGKLKYLIRSILLQFSPHFAMRNFTYMGMALCKTKA